MPSLNRFLSRFKPYHTGSKLFVEKCKCPDPNFASTKTSPPSIEPSHQHSNSISFHNWQHDRDWSHGFSTPSHVIIGKDYKKRSLGGKSVFNLGFSDTACISSGLKCLPIQEENESEEGQRCTDRINTQDLQFLSGACSLPRPEKEQTGGEDAYFICHEEHVIGVADGVSGWADVHVDAGQYARELMTQASIAVRQEPLGFVDPARVLRTAYSNTTYSGSCTACIVALSNHGLRAANLGDSGFIIVRNGRILFRSAVQLHYFGIPFQLENGGGDPPSAAEIFTLGVAAGDIIIAGTDGLFDNLYNNELASIIVQSALSGLSPQVMAEKIVSRARSRAEDRNASTPFSVAAQDAGFRFHGGKMDDITVVVSYVTKLS